MPGTVLVIDDDPSILGMVQTVLRRKDFDVAVATSGNEAIARLAERRYDAVVLDLFMDDGTGEDVLTALAVQQPDVKCVVIISATSAARIAKTDMANVTAKLRKPFDIEELVAAVQQCMVA